MFKGVSMGQNVRDNRYLQNSSVARAQISKFGVDCCFEFCF